MLDKKIVQRLEELIRKGEELLATRQDISGQRGNVFVVASPEVDRDKGPAWGISSLSFIGRIFGKDSEHYQAFYHVHNQCFLEHKARTGLAVLRACYDDYCGGYLVDIQIAIRADVFEEFLDQAKLLLDQGHFQPAAGTIGAVLEDGLRNLCVRHGISLSAKPKLDQMNADLAKAGVYTTLVQKNITALADLRNLAAHGRWDEFKSADVEDMYARVRRFMEEHFSS